MLLTQLKRVCLGFDISSRFFELSNNGKIIVSHGYKGVYKLTVNTRATISCPLDELLNA